MPLKARSIDAHMRSVGTWVDWKGTCDTFKSGDPDTVVEAIAVSWMSTTKALKEAHARGCNVFITHEPTFYSHMDDDPAFNGDRCTQEKRAFLKETGMVVYRCHDVWDQMPAWGIQDRWARHLGLGIEPVTRERFMRVYRIEETTAGVFGRRVAEMTRAFGQETVLLIGELDQKVARVAVGTGAITSVREYHRMGADLGIITELTWWRDAAWARDMGMPALVVDHTVSEEPGMIGLAEYLQGIYRDVRVEYISTNCPYRAIRAQG